MPQISKDQYSPLTGLVYVFNLIVGTGALTLPSVFQHAGWGLGLTLILVLSFVSYVTVTFVIESMASANAIIRWRQLQCINASEVAEDSESDNEAEDAPLNVSRSHDADISDQPALYFIRKKIETGEMAALFFTRYGQTLMYVCFAIYLYGDLAIYGAAVSKTLVDVACTYRPVNSSCNTTLLDTEQCWESSEVNRMDSYRLFLTVFVCVLGPFVFFNIQKTKYLQISTTLMRWFAFTFMIVYAIHKLVTDGAKGSPPIADISGVPGLFGACVYSFMCHHSLPSLVSPIADKSRLTRLLALDYILIASFYVLLAMTGAFAFPHVFDLYTLNFSPSASGDCGAHPGIAMTIVGYVLTLFPVFTLSTSYPIIAITLRNNLTALFLKEGVHYPWPIRRLLFPFLAIIPPTIIAYITKDLKILVGVTGSYAGTGIQYFIPAFLVLGARRETQKFIDPSVKNGFLSPFRHQGWAIFVIVWAVGCIILVSVNNIYNHVL